MSMTQGTEDKKKLTQRPCAPGVAALVAGRALTADAEDERTSAGPALLFSKYKFGRACEKVADI